MKKSLVLVLSCLSLISFAENTDLTPSLEEVRVINPKGADLEVKDLSKKVQQVYEVAKEIISSDEESFPVIIFEEFKRKQNTQALIDFQDEWLKSEAAIAITNKTGSSPEKSFNAKNLPGSYYSGTPYIQIRPSYMTQSYPYTHITMGGPRTKGLNQGLYTIGHEMLHFLLEKKGLKIWYHHCLMMKRFHGKKTIMEMLLNKLVRLKIVDRRLLKSILKIELSKLPCHWVSEEEMQMLEEFALENLK